jgi:hypothetical protein
LSRGLGDVYKRQVRAWGFHCPERGWVPWQDFTDPADPGLTGRGCEP